MVHLTNDFAAMIYTRQWMFAFRWGVNWKWANEMIRQIGWRREGVKEEKNASKRGEREGREIKIILGEESQLGELEERRRKYIKKTEEGNIWREPAGCWGRGRGRRRGEQATSFANSSPHTFPPTPSTSPSSSSISPWKFQEFVRFDKKCSCLQLVTCGWSRRTRKSMWHWQNPVLAKVLPSVEEETWLSRHSFDAKIKIRRRIEIWIQQQMIDIEHKN